MTEVDGLRQLATWLCNWTLCLVPSKTHVFTGKGNLKLAQYPAEFRTLVDSIAYVLVWCFSFCIFVQCNLLPPIRKSWHFWLLTVFEMLDHLFPSQYLWKFIKYNIMKVLLCRVWLYYSRGRMSRGLTACFPVPTVTRICDQWERLSNAFKNSEWWWLFYLERSYKPLNYVKLNSKYNGKREATSFLKYRTTGKH